MNPLVSLTFFWFNLSIGKSDESAFVARTNRGLSTLAMVKLRVFEQKRRVSGIRKIRVGNACISIVPECLWPERWNPPSPITRNSKVQTEGEDWSSFNCRSCSFIIVSYFKSMWWLICLFSHHSRVIISFFVKNPRSRFRPILFVWLFYVVSFFFFIFSNLWTLSLAVDVTFFNSIVLGVLLWNFFVDFGLRGSFSFYRTKLYLYIYIYIYSNIYRQTPLSSFSSWISLLLLCVLCSRGF